MVFLLRDPPTQGRLLDESQEYGLVERDGRGVEGVGAGFCGV
jgi:hypothetical protein